MGNKPGTKLRSVERDYILQRTNFNANEVAEWYKAFQKDCPKGYLTLEDFKYIYAQYFPSGDSTSFATRMFHQFDLDNDGMVSFRDFIMSLYLTSRRPAREKIEWAFALYDTDHDGFISQPEMLAIVTSIYQMVGPSMHMPDDETTPEKRTAKIFAQYDLDHDGKLSHDEFVRSGLVDPMVGRLLNGETGATGATSRMTSSAATTLRS